DAGEGVTVTVSQADEHTAGKGEALAGFTLARVLPGKRPMAWAGLVAILLAFLAIPVWTHATRERVEPDYDRPGATRMDASWSTGALSSAHHGLGDNCEACHVEPFVAVRDGTCLACHTDISDHAAQPRQSLARGPLKWGEAIQWQV